MSWNPFYFVIRTYNTERVVIMEKIIH